MYDCPEVAEERVFRTVFHRSGLSATMARYYNPSVGRFVSEDPFEKQEQRSGPYYPYVGNNPVFYRDPEGLKRCKVTKKCCPVFEVADLTFFLNWNLDRLPNPLRGSDKPYATTYCLARDIFGGSTNKISPWTECHDRFFASGGCVQRCVVEHELIHRRNCFTSKSAAADETEALIFSIQCAQKYLLQAGIPPELVVTSGD